MTTFPEPATARPNESFAMASFAVRIPCSVQADPERRKTCTAPAFEPVPFTPLPPPFPGVPAGATLSVYTGAFGAVLSMPIINLGQSAIITMEAITKQSRVVGDNAIAVRSVVAACLAFDHRVMDGHQAGYFLRDVKKRLEAITPETGLD